MNRTGSRITDDRGRTLILRGVNLGGSSKLPFGVKGSSPDALKNPPEVSFAGRPFPLEEADEHFEKLKSFGFTFVRFVLTWEALEHSGPGIYDEAYLAYLRKILLSAEKKGIAVLMDPHQDVWSRWTGGDGAPAWTLEKLGMDLDKLEAAGAAITAQGYAGTHGGKPYPKMLWPVNYSLYAAATMFTLFFGGNVFAPEVKIEGESAQDWLQEKYLAAFRHCFRRLKNCGAIAGWGAMNEPHPGFIGCRNLTRQENFTILKGAVPNPFEAMIAASGNAVEVPVYKLGAGGWKAVSRETINREGVSLFREGYTCPWKQAGVWTEAGGAKLLKSDHFSNYRGRPVRFADDFLKPFILRFIERMKGAERPVLFFIEGIPHGEAPSWNAAQDAGAAGDAGENPENGKRNPEETVNAFHHYDGFTLFTKSFRPWLTADQNTRKIILGRKKTAAHYSAKLAEAKAWARDHMDDMPCLLGEFGLPFDLNRKKAFRTGDYRAHEEALSLYYDGIDENLLGSTLWNYSADNTNAEGDHWNGEDLSIIAGGKERAEGGWLRPYPAATAGLPLEFHWDRKKAALYFRFRAAAEIEAPTEIFLPIKWFGNEPRISAKQVNTERGLMNEYRKEEQRLFVYNNGYGGEAEVRVSGKARASGPEAKEG